ncbi:hypothetical protein [Dictyobacter arantiisoli]|uniref:Uncharacterized protein n=1 Tax=Dictyobacter arantiisoli TaxID=2014874 RepID=A0A5A5TC34_9CHLR|nr:hypothetical protein [Dictyobacter arantiisoli]GCF08494.1 hypothetical protein KDI_20580 [Dictyobacter arantiisoli]
MALEEVGIKPKINDNKPEGDDAPKLKGDDAPKPNDENIARPKGDDAPKPNSEDASKRPEEFGRKKLQKGDNSPKNIKLVRDLATKFNDAKEIPQELIDTVRKKSLSSSPVPKPFYKDLLNVTELAQQKAPIESWAEVGAAEKALQWYRNYTRTNNIDSKSIIDNAQQYLTDKRMSLPTPREMAFNLISTDKVPFDLTSSDRVPFDLTRFDKDISTSESQPSTSAAKTIEITKMQRTANDETSKINTQYAVFAEQYLPALAEKITKKETYIGRVANPDNDKMRAEIMPGETPNAASQIADRDIIEKKLGRVEESLRQIDVEKHNLSTIKDNRIAIEQKLSETGRISKFFSYSLRKLERSIQNLPNDEAIDKRLSDIEEREQKKLVTGKALLYALGKGEAKDETYYTAYLLRQQEKLKDMQLQFTKVVMGNNIEAIGLKFDQLHTTDTLSDQSAGLQMLSSFVKDNYVPKLFDGLSTHLWIGEPMMYEGLGITVALQNHGVGVNFGATIADREGGYSTLGVLYLVNTAIHAVKGFASYKLQGRYERALQQFKQGFTEEQFYQVKQLPDEHQWIINRDEISQKKQKSPFKIDYDKAWNRYKALSKPSEEKGQEGVLLPADNLKKHDLESRQQLKEILFLHMMKHYRGIKPFKRSMESVATSLAFGAGAITYATVGLGAGVFGYAAAALAHVAITDTRYFKHDMRGRHARAIIKSENSITRDMATIIDQTETGQEIKAAKAEIVGANKQSWLSTKKTEKTAENSQPTERGTNNDGKIDKKYVPDDNVAAENRRYYDAINRALQRTEEVVQNKHTFFSENVKKQYVDDLFDRNLKEELNQLARDEVKAESWFSMRKRFNPDRDEETRQKLSFCAQTASEMVRNLLSSSEKTPQQNAHLSQVPSEQQKSINIHVLEAVSEKDALDKLAARGFTFTDPTGMKHEPTEVMDAFVRYKTAMALLTDGGAIKAEKNIRGNIRKAAMSINKIAVSKNTGNEDTKIIEESPFEGLEKRTDAAMKGLPIS